MRREQLGELVNLTSQVPSHRRTAEMPAVELVDLLRRDRELGEPPRITAEHFDTSARYELDGFEDGPPPQLAAGTVILSRRSHVKLVLGCLAAFASGFAATIPLWW
jgi:hypothetical protein